MLPLLIVPIVVGGAALLSGCQRGKTPELPLAEIPQTDNPTWDFILRIRKTLKGQGVTDQEIDQGYYPLGQAGGPDDTPVGSGDGVIQEMELYRKVHDLYQREPDNPVYQNIVKDFSAFASSAFQQGFRNFGGEPTCFGPPPTPIKDRIYFYERALAMDPSMWSALYYLAYDAVKVGYEDEARAAYRTLIESAQQAISGGQTGLASEMLHHAIKIKGSPKLWEVVHGEDYAQAQYNLAHVLYTKGHLTEAYLHLQQAAFYFRDYPDKDGVMMDRTQAYLDALRILMRGRGIPIPEDPAFIPKPDPVLDAKKAQARANPNSSPPLRTDALIEKFIAEASDPNSLLRGMALASLQMKAGRFFQGEKPPTEPSLSQLDQEQWALDRRGWDTYFKMESYIYRGERSFEIFVASPEEAEKFQEVVLSLQETYPDLRVQITDSSSLPSLISEGPRGTQPTVLYFGG